MMEQKFSLLKGFLNSLEFPWGLPDIVLTEYWTSYLKI